MGDSRSKDPFLCSYRPSELRTASEFLQTWLPFLTKDLCKGCTRHLSDRIRSLDPETFDTQHSHLARSDDVQPLSTCEDGWESPNSLGSSKSCAKCYTGSATQNGVQTDPRSMPGSVEPQNERMSWADMAQKDDEFEEEGREVVSISADEDCVTEDLGIEPMARNEKKLSWDERNLLRFLDVKRKKDFICRERVDGRLINILEGLELHFSVFSAKEQSRIVDNVYKLEEMGRTGLLKPRTYTAPRKWMRGKGRVTIQFGCCYNYATDKNGNAPGILQNEPVDRLPRFCRIMIKRLVTWHIVPPSCVPDSCIINIYEEGDCIPPHIDSHDFVRPFCTVSFLSECSILFGRRISVVSAGVFSGSYQILLPVGSVLVLNGNGADVAKHCIPAVPMKRISITFRKMDESKRPIGYYPDPDLQGLKPLAY